MTKKGLCVVAMLVVCAAVFADSVKVSFNFAKMSGYATNQFAVWVEDASGHIVKTLFVTKFTSKKGWKTRPDALAEWVSKANPASGIDAASGATPKSGALSYVWDLTDADGKPVDAGIYTVKVEANQFWEKRLVAESAVQIGANSSVEVAPVVVTQIPATDPTHDKNDTVVTEITIQTVR